MTLRQLYDDFLERLQAIYDRNEADQIRKIVFNWGAGVTRADIMVNAGQQLEAARVVIIEGALKRLLAHEPVQYITGEAWFYKMKFEVSPAVLIPRPETEELVENVLLFTKNKKALAVLDIGSGSGCIPIVIKNYARDAKVTSIDLSYDALIIAKKNAQALNADVAFLQVDFLQEAYWQNFGKFDVIVSNPPYIPAAEAAIMGKNVTNFEPAKALFVPDDRPYIFYEKIAAFAKTHLAENGKIFMEVHEDHAKQIAALFKKEGFVAEIKIDISGKERMVICSRL